MGLIVDMARGDGAREAALTGGELIRVWEQVLADRGVERDCRLSVTLLADEAMAELNGEWRGVAAPTDVISIECEGPWDDDLAEGEPCILGDIFLAPDHIARQARAMGTTAADETCLLAVHGMLHLLGYDHDEEADAEVMGPIEDALVARLTDGRVDHVVLTRHRDGS